MVQKKYDFDDPLRHASGFDDAEVSLIDGLMDDHTMWRLGGIAFLGAIDYVRAMSVNRGSKAPSYTRRQHSAGVLRLASSHCDLARIDHADRLPAYAAALLHDIGHFPLSHSMEKAAAEYTGIDHHDATQAIIRGKSTIGRNVQKILAEHGVDAGFVADLVAGKSDEYSGFFSGPITFDTIEGVCRTHNYNGGRYGLADVPNPLAVVEAATLRRGTDDAAIVDAFWLAKQSAYQNVVHSPTGLLADHAATECFDEGPDNFKRYGIHEYDDTYLLNKLPGLKRILRGTDLESAVATRFGKPERYTERSYFVDSSVEFSPEKDAERYCVIRRESPFPEMESRTLRQAPAARSSVER